MWPHHRVAMCMGSEWVAAAEPFAVNRKKSYLMFEMEPIDNNCSIYISFNCVEFSMERNNDATNELLKCNIWYELRAPHRMLSTADKNFIYQNDNSTWPNKQTKMLSIHRTRSPINGRSTENVCIGPAIMMIGDGSALSVCCSEHFRSLVEENLSALRSWEECKYVRLKRRCGRGRKRPGRLAVSFSFYKMVATSVPLPMS